MDNLSAASSAPVSPALSAASSASATSTTSNNTSSRFKTIKKKIKSTFKSMSKRGSLAEVDQVLKRSIEFEQDLEGALDDATAAATTPAGPDNTTIEDGAEEATAATAIINSAKIVQFQNEFKALKDALEKMVNESRLLQTAIKTADSNCPDPFEQPESFSLYLAKRADSNFLLEDMLVDADGSNERQRIETEKLQKEIEQLKALKLTNESLHQAEREALAATMAQLEVLKTELDQVNKQNAAFMSQIAQLKEAANSTTTVTSSADQSIQLTKELTRMQSLNEELRSNNQQLSTKQQELTAQLESAQVELDTLKQALSDSGGKTSQQLAALREENDRLIVDLDALSRQQEHWKLANTDLETKLRELNETNARLSLELKDTQNQLTELEKEALKEERTDAVVDEVDFKYTYLSNVILQYLQRPEQRPELIKVLAETLQLSPEDYYKVRL